MEREKAEMIDFFSEPTSGMSTFGQMAKVNSAKVAPVHLSEVSLSLMPGASKPLKSKQMKNGGGSTTATAPLGILASS